LISRKEVSFKVDGRIIFALMCAMTVVAWVTFAEHPTARNLRTAISDTLAL
jgi:hypothetical protein